MKNSFYIKEIIEKFSLFNRDSENIVIGRMLNNAIEIEEVLFYLNPKDFDLDIKIKEFLLVCMLNLHKKGLYIDPIIVLTSL
ncbi:DnaB-like helicase N-terminal domain-containing protein [Borreliella lusitaniae]|uniref:DnaB-like helicase N-terminal domain-containing protein n=1 Tax=Borreliella lusitaniae TaxID=100177 RepID=A0ABZ0CJ49_9SPIR|nr:DnaB-like helicase N-terminal domain-containing protein [Borreliella lusitaniae]WNY69097.1 hypothetical protein QIA44_04525 [Borreliella lusitaniae]